LGLERAPGRAAIPREESTDRDDPWFAQVEDKIATIGISTYAQDELGDVVFVSLPNVGDEISVG
jgi:glycine cleavage system H protein